MRVDEIVIREFLHTSYPRLVAAVALVSGSRPAAEDAVQEALLRAWERSEFGASIESLDAWVATVAFNLARSGVRRLMAESRARSCIRTMAGITDPADGERVDIERALASLSRRQREIVVSRYHLRMDTREVARVLKVSEGTIKRTLARARRTLAAALGDPEEEEASRNGA